MRLVRATQTSIACPAQWDAYDEDGNYWYLRYRHGVGQARCYGPSVADFDGLSDEQWRNPIETFEFEHGHPLDGDITLEEFALRAGFGIAPELRETGYTQYLADELGKRGVDSKFIEAFGLPPARSDDD